VGNLWHGGAGGILFNGTLRGDNIISVSPARLDILKGGNVLGLGR